MGEAWKDDLTARLPELAGRIAVLPIEDVPPDGLPLPESPDETPEARQYLVCVAERDLSTLLPLLPQLATNRDIVPAAA